MGLELTPRKCAHYVWCLLFPLSRRISDALEDLISWGFLRDLKGLSETE